MLKSDFDFTLPPEQVAVYPSAERTQCRLLAVDEEGALSDLVFSGLGRLLRPGDLLVLNDTRVMPARLYGSKSTGGQVELLLDRIAAPHRALAHIRSSAALRPGAEMLTAGGVRLRVLGRSGELYEICAPGGDDLEQVLEREGHMPLPPYLHRPDEPLDRERYQTVYGCRPGAVAAPTAGLHFDLAQLEELRAAGIGTAFVTLHVGAGTFSPLRTERVEEHRMHAEYARLDAAAAEQVLQARQRGRRVIAVGTTAVRVLESAAALAARQGGGLICPFEGETSIFIYPGYRFAVTDALITNFHLPQSTLIMLVAALAGFARTMGAYAHAADRGYRFYSYGDAMFVARNPAAARDLPPSAALPGAPA